ncbi:DNA-binding transcriptional regulator, AcrR family [Fontibacillus panacisegetis]|uniref:DNA-binding transcriptional regulator, AcrR family n=1 Tax=Fontibacillus panacisegetis TaxID=670482 RepID=A0A1G7JQT2_9BACL|nr:TetR/AcrR family transcriptional regulator [Fontibacillus panacisegetis]SDF26809.1 DNA-binding transcriptional regulator, AcrR family [Fontibacillus panacisegetis]
MSQQEPMEQWIRELAKLDDPDSKMTEKQFKIIQAAVEIFAEKGFAGSSTSEIAQRAGVAEGTIFRHYKTKKDLLISIVAPMMSKLIAPFVWNDFKDVLEKEYTSLEEFLYEIAVNRLNFTRKHLKIIKILLQEIPFQPDLKDAFKRQVGMKIFQKISEIIEYFKSKGEVIDMPTPTLVRFLASSFIGLFATHFILLPDQPWDEEKEIRDTIQFILDGLSTK